MMRVVPTGEIEAAGKGYPLLTVPLIVPPAVKSKKANLVIGLSA